MRTIKTTVSQLLANTLYQCCKEGASLNQNFDSPESGYMVSIVDGPVFDCPVNVNVLDVAAFIRKQSIIEFNGSKDHYYGVWTDEKTRNIHFDLSLNIPDRNTAIDLGKRYNQIAIWDVENCKEIRLK